jgi:hypothetical protein
MLRGYCTSTVDESRSSPSSPRALSPARATLEPLIRLDRTPVISKHVHDLEQYFFCMDRGVPTSEVDLHYWIHSTSGPATASYSIPTLVCTRSSRQKTQSSTGVYGVVIPPPTGDLVPFKWQASLATSACRFQSTRRPHLPALSSACCSRRGKRPI